MGKSHAIILENFSVRYIFQPETEVLRFRPRYLYRRHGPQFLVVCNGVQEIPMIICH